MVVKKYLWNYPWRQHRWCSLFTEPCGKSAKPSPLFWKVPNALAFAIAPPFSARRVIEYLCANTSDIDSRSELIESDFSYKWIGQQESKMTVHFLLIDLSSWLPTRSRPSPWDWNYLSHISPKKSHLQWRPREVGTTHSSIQWSANKTGAGNLA